MTTQLDLFPQRRPEGPGYYSICKGGAVWPARCVFELRPGLLYVDHLEHGNPVPVEYYADCDFVPMKGGAA